MSMPSGKFDYRGEIHRVFLPDSASVEGDPSNDYSHEGLS